VARYYFYDVSLPRLGMMPEVLDIGAIIGASEGTRSVDTSTGEITQLLAQLKDRNKDAAPRLFELLYHELRRIAQHHFANERAEHSLQATALVHEAYMRLVGGDGHWENRAHFLAVASSVMRRILVDHARAKRAAKRPDSRQKVVLEEVLLISSRDIESVIDVDHALSRLAVINVRQSQIVELRYFGGLTTEETAAVLGVSLITVKRDWAVARAWLYGELKHETPA
jgi:RNA polymerase sigma factor (TIGR02999 family)